MAVANFMHESGLPHDLYSGFNAGIDKAFRNRDLRGLRMVARDSQEWAQGLSERMRAELDAKLVKRFGYEFGLTGANTATLDEISRIVINGRIEGEEEYLLLLGRVDELLEDDPESSELAELNRLLIAFRSR